MAGAETSISRESILSTTATWFSECVDAAVAQVVDDSDGMSAEQVDAVKKRFQQAFDNFFERGFDAVFSKELLGQSAATAEAADSPLDVTVTEDDLLNLDCALENATAKRDKYPPKLSQFLDRAMHHMADAAKHVRTNVPATELPKREVDPEALGKEVEAVDNAGNAALEKVREEAKMADKLMGVTRVLSTMN